MRGSLLGWALSSSFLWIAASSSLFLSRFSVVALETRQYAIGDTITMQLMQREKGVLIPLPKSKQANVEQPVRLGGESRQQVLMSGTWVGECPPFRHISASLGAPPG